VARYGQTDAAYAMQLATSTADGPIYMLNLLKYRPVADYGGPGEPGVTGREADCRYAPLDLVLAGGAALCFVAEVVAGRDGWDRVCVLRYPSRQSFIGLASGAEYRERQVHREAVLERFTILGTVPATVLPRTATARRVLLEVWDGTEPKPVTQAEAVSFDVEGTVIGDGRHWTGARYTVIEAGTPLPLQQSRPDYQALLLEPRVERWEWQN
jgi:hypothetical protein